jgi:hypothetical protein
MNAGRMVNPATCRAAVEIQPDAMEEPMRMFMKVSMPVETGNRAAVDGSLPKTIQAILAEQKPEAAYFVAADGKRTGFIFLDLKSTADIPAIAEPWFLAFNATIEITPAMTVQDLAAAGPGIESAVKKYGSLARGAGAK